MTTDIASRKLTALAAPLGPPVAFMTESRWAQRADAPGIV